ncbi:MAG: 5'/3'-nucleotidase SurE [Candidatus Caldarchaeum sp.]|nr:5'/3'-nucleotidase SurE [Candidatus Caldarchaeales archaeon]
MKKILLTNDDGVLKTGLWALYDVLKDLGEVTVVAPESMRSAVGMSITLHKPLRLRKIRVGGKVAYSCSGTPSDCVIIAVRQVYRGKGPDLVVSGINEGNNVSLQSVYGSGTIGAVIRASLMGYPAAAFSLALPEDRIPSAEWMKTMMAKAAAKAKPVISYLLKHGLPQGVDYLNINFPHELTDSTPYVITKTARNRYREMVEERIDPRGKPYYWLKGELRSDLEPGTDAYAVFMEKAISITLMKTDTSAPQDVDGSALLNYLKSL